MNSDRESNLSRSFVRKSSFSAQSPKNRVNYDNRQLDSIICGSHASYYILDLIDHGIYESELNKLSIISSVDLTMQQLIHVQDFLQQKCDHSNNPMMIDLEPPPQKIENFSNYVVQLQIREQAPLSMVDQKMAKQYSQFSTTIAHRLVSISSKLKESSVKLREASFNDSPSNPIIYVPLEDMELHAPSENELEQDIFYRKIHQQKLDVQYQREKYVVQFINERIKVLLREKDNKAKQALAQVSKDDKKFTYDYDSSIILVKENSSKLPNISLLPTSKIIHSQIFQEQNNKPEIIQLNSVKKSINQVNRPSLNMQMDFELKGPKIHNDIIRVQYQNQQFDHIIQQDYIKVLEDTKTRLSKKQLQDIIEQQNYSVKAQKKYSYDTNIDQDVTNQNNNDSNKHQLKSILDQQSQNMKYPSNLKDSDIKENKRATSVSYGQIKYQSLNKQQYKGFLEISPNETLRYINPEKSKKQRNLINLSNDRIVVNKEDNAKFLVSRQSGSQQPLLPLIKKFDRAESRCRSRQQNRSNIEKQKQEQ